MADVEDDDVEEVKTGHAGDQGKALNKLTEVGAERELDAASMQASLSSVMQLSEKQKQAAAERERELAKVQLTAGDVQVLSAEFELTAAAAERILREHKGDMASALQFLLQ
eukprot:TRINITY_DN4013_c0_g1_i1.p1 TRINITY_DN4013_c0_g1~~TRINITY_DN4013_c0_g1_i1.p1  ORF type:complete len:111 (-),score=41.31 TRINITY_DN4013_c0_g1_i1:23-355(-)